MNLLEGNPVPNMKINPRAKQDFHYGGHEISGGMPCSIELRGSQLSLPFEFLGSLMYLALLQYIYYINIYIYYINIYTYIYIYISININIYQYIYIIYSTIPATSTCSAIHGLENFWVNGSLCLHSRGCGIFMANTAHVMRSPVMIHFSWIQQSQYGKCKGQMTWIFLGAQRLHHITTIHQNNIGWKFHIMRIVKQFWVSTTFFFRNTTHFTNFTNQRFTQHQDSAKGEEVQPWSGEFLGHQDAHRERSTAMSDPEHCPWRGFELLVLTMNLVRKHHK